MLYKRARLFVSIQPASRDRGRSITELFWSFNQKPHSQGRGPLSQAGPKLCSYAHRSEEQIHRVDNLWSPAESRVYLSGVLPTDRDAVVSWDRCFCTLGAHLQHQGPGAFIYYPHHGFILLNWLPAHLLFSVSLEFLSHRPSSKKKRLMLLSNPLGMVCKWPFFVKCFHTS